MRKSFLKLTTLAGGTSCVGNVKENLTTAALANTTGRAKAEMTTPVVRKVQNSLRAEEVERSSVWRRANRVGRGAKR